MLFFSWCQAVLQSSNTNWMSSNSVPFWHCLISTDPTGYGLSPTQRLSLRGRPPAGAQADIGGAKPARWWRGNPWSVNPQTHRLNSNGQEKLLWLQKPVKKLQSPKPAQRQEQPHWSGDRNGDRPLHSPHSQEPRPQVPLSQTFSERHARSFLVTGPREATTGRFLSPDWHDWLCGATENKENSAACGQRTCSPADGCWREEQLTALGPDRWREDTCPEKVWRLPGSSQADWWKSFPVWSQFRKTGTGDSFYKCPNPSPK